MMKNIKHQISKIKKKIATSASRRRVALWRSMVGLLAMTLFLIAGLAFPKPVLALVPSDWTTTYWLHQETSTVITATTSWQFSYGYTPPPPDGGDMDQTESVNTSVKPGNGTTEIQFYPGTPNRSTGGLTNGYGWIFDSPLNGQYDAGTWTFYVRLRLTNGQDPTGTVRAYVKRYDGSSTYTDLFTATSGSITPTSTATTYSFTASPGTVDMQGQYLYVHYSWQTSSGGNNPTTIAFHVEGNGLSAADKARIVPPGSSIDALGYALISISIVFFIAVLVKKRILYVKKVQVA